MAVTPPTTPGAPKRDHELRILGEAFAAASKALGDNDLDDIERTTLIANWRETIDAMCSVEAQSAAGRRIKASAIITFFARTGDIHKLALSLCGEKTSFPKTTSKHHSNSAAPALCIKRRGVNGITFYYSTISH